MSTAREFLGSAKGILALVFSILGAVFFLFGAVMLAVAFGTRMSGAPGVVGAGLGAGATAFLAIGAVIGVVGLALGARRRAELRERARLREHGVACDGTVVEVEQNFRVRVNRRHPWIVRYRYQAGGVDRSGEESVMDLPETVRPGERVAVVYDPADPSRSTLKAT